MIIFQSSVLWSHCPNEDVCSDCLKWLYDKSSCLRSIGRLFQIRGPAALKALSRKLVQLTSLCLVQSSWASVGDEASVVSHVDGSVSRRRLVDQCPSATLKNIPGRDLNDQDQVCITDIFRHTLMYCSSMSTRSPRRLSLSTGDFSGGRSSRNSCGTLTSSDLAIFSIS